MHFTTGCTVVGVVLMLEHFTSSAMKIIARSNPRLGQLQLMSASAITTQDIIGLIESCPRFYGLGTVCCDLIDRDVLGEYVAVTERNITLKIKTSLEVMIEMGQGPGM